MGLNPAEAPCRVRPAFTLLLQIRLLTEENQLSSPICDKKLGYSGEPGIIPLLPPKIYVNAIEIVSARRHLTVEEEKEKHSDNSVFADGCTSLSLLPFCRHAAFARATSVFLDRIINHLQTDVLRRPSLKIAILLAAARFTQATFAHQPGRRVCRCVVNLLNNIMKLSINLPFCF